MKFEDVYRGYVIRDKGSDMFVGPNSERWRVALREHAGRFTKKGAMKFLDQHKKEKFYIEDAK